MEREIQKLSVDLMFEQSKSYQLQKELEKSLSNSIRNNKATSQNENNDDAYDDDYSLPSSFSRSSSSSYSHNRPTERENTKEMKDNDDNNNLIMKCLDNTNVQLHNQNSTNGIEKIVLSSLRREQQNQLLKEIHQSSQQRHLSNNIQNEHLIMLIRERDLSIKEQEMIIESLEQQLSLTQQIVVTTGIEFQKYYLRNGDDVCSALMNSNHHNEFAIMKNSVTSPSQKHSDSIKETTISSSFSKNVTSYERYKMGLGSVKRSSLITDDGENKIDGRKIVIHIPSLQSNICEDQEAIMKDLTLETKGIVDLNFTNPANDNVRMPYLLQSSDYLLETGLQPATTTKLKEQDMEHEVVKVVSSTPTLTTLRNKSDLITCVIKTNEYEDNITELKSSNQEASTALNAITKERNDFEERFLVQEHLIATLQTELGQSSSKILALEVANETLLTKNNEITLLCNTLTANVKSLQSSINTLEEENEDLNYSSTLYAEQVQNYDKQVQELLDDVEQHRIHMQTNTVERDGLLKQVKELLQEKEFFLSAMGLIWNNISMTTGTIPKYDNNEAGHEKSVFESVQKM